MGKRIKRTYILHCGEQDPIEAIMQRLDKIDATLTTMGTNMDANLTRITEKLEEIKAETGQYIADRDARDAALQAIIDAKDAAIAGLMAELAAGAITIQEFQAQAAGAALQADAAADLLPPVRPPNVPVTLAAAYVSADALIAAAAAYPGPATLDGATLTTVGGTSPQLDFFSHSADGSVSTTGPTD